MGRGDFQALAPRCGGCEVKKRRKLMQIRTNGPEASRPTAGRLAMLLCHSTLRIMQRFAVRAHRLGAAEIRSEEHTSELQSQSNLVCRLLLEKKKQNHRTRDKI